MIRRRGVVVTLMGILVVAAMMVLSACGGDEGADDSTPRIVVSIAPYQPLVKELVGDDATVELLVPDGRDPHDAQLSVKDAEKLTSATLIIVNGAGLESGIDEAIDRARDEGVPVISVADHVRLRESADDEHDHDHDHGEESGDDHADESHDEHDHGAEDPHIWLDPVLMGEAMAAIAPAIEKETGITTGDRAADLKTRLDALNTEMGGMIDAIPEERRVLVSGHDSLGYFAERFHMRVVGAVIPNQSTQAEASARHITELAATIKKNRVPAMFIEVGTPKAVADAIGKESGAKVVEINTHALASDGSYFTTMRELMGTIVNGLSGAD